MHIDKGANVQLCQSVWGQMSTHSKGDKFSGGWGGGAGNMSYTRLFHIRHAMLVMLYFVLGEEKTVLAL